MERGSVYVGDIHRHLGYAVFIYEPADCLATFQRTRNHHVLTVLILHDLASDRVALSLRTAFFAYIECNRVGTACRCRVEVVVDGDQEVARSYIGGTSLSRTLGIFPRPEIRLTVRVTHLLRKRLILTCTAYGQVLSLRLLSCSFIAVARNLKLIVDTLCELACKFGTLLKGNA